VTPGRTAPRPSTCAINTPFINQVQPPTDLASVNDIQASQILAKTTRAGHKPPGVAGMLSTIFIFLSNARDAGADEIDTSVVAGTQFLIPRVE